MVQKTLVRFKAANRRATVWDLKLRLTALVKIAFADEHICLTIACARRSEDSGDKDPWRRAEQNASIFQQENHRVFHPSKIIHRNTRGEEIEDGKILGESGW
jgi:hypothetical protein